MLKILEKMYLNIHVYTVLGIIKLMITVFHFIPIYFQFNVSMIVVTVVLYILKGHFSMLEKYPTQINIKIKYR